jgi:aquaporin Z
MDRLLRPCVAELIAAFIVTFVGGGAICIDAFLTRSGKPGVGLIGIILAQGIAYAIAVTATMRTSGGHANPAVTVAMLFVGKITAARAFYYILSQFLGAVIGGFFLTVLFQSTNIASDRQVALGTPHIFGLQELFGRNEINMQLLALATLVELLISFVLVFAFFATVVDYKNLRLGGLWVGLAATAGMILAYQLTGAAMNPARYFGTALWDAGMLSDFSRLGDCYIYILGPILGAVLASWIYTSYVSPEEASQPVA